MPLLGEVNADAQKNIRKAKKEEEERRQRRRRRKAEEELEVLENELLSLPTVQKVPENIDLPEHKTKGKKVFQAYEFIPCNLDYVEGLVVFYDDGTAEILISAVPYEYLSRPLLKEIRLWGVGDDGSPGFERSPFKIRDGRDEYALFFSPRGVSVKTEKEMKHVDAFDLLSAYFAWVYDEVMQENNEEDIDEFPLSKNVRIAVERYLTGWH